MKISIITVCKNAELYIERTIKSIISQTYKNIEYIVIDGNSQDNTKKIIQKYSSNITRLVTEPDEGIYDAMNKGIKIATGSFIQFLNSDDYLYDDKVIEDVVNFIQGHPNCQIIYGDAQIRPDPKLSSGEPYIIKSPLPSNIAESLICGHFFLQGSIFFNAELFSVLGLFDNRYKIAADYEYYTRFLTMINLEAQYYPRTIFSFFMGGLAGTNPKATLQEMFEIQNKAVFFQNDYWNNRRVLRFQAVIVELNQALQEKQIFINKLKNPIFILQMTIKYLLARLFKIEI